MANGPTCSACNFAITQEPPEAIHDPDGPAPSNPEAHLFINHGSKGARFHCTETGQMTSITAGPDGDTILTPKQYYEKLGIKNGGGKEEGGPSAQEKTGSSERPQSGQEQIQQPQRKEPGLDLKEDLEPLDILSDVLQNPIYELSDPQIREVLSWAEEFNDGMIPPDSLEEILGLLEGISKQKAQLMRQKYELKIQRWMREQSHNETGPPIGVMGRRRGANQNSINIAGGGSNSPNVSGVSRGEHRLPQQEEDDGEPERVIDRRREKAQERVDEFADEFLSSFASNVGDDAGRFYSDFRRIIITALENKAAEDPDWVIEKLDGVGGFDFLNEIMGSSDTKKRQDATERSKMAVDAEVDDIASTIQQEDQPPPPQNHQQQPQTNQQQQRQPQQTQNQQPQEQRQPQQSQPQENQYTEENPSESFYEDESEENPMETLINEEGEGELESEPQDDGEEMFEETFGQLGSE